MPSDRLDMRLGGDLRRWLEEKVGVEGAQMATIVQKALIRERLQDAQTKERIRRLLLDLLRTIEAGDDPDALLRSLGAVLGSAPAAEGIGEALRIVAARQTPDGSESR